MKTIQATELRKNLFDQLDLLAAGGEPVQIVRFKKPTALLIPLPDPSGNRKPLLDLDAVAAFCRRHSIRSFALFGSILTDRFDTESDVDVLVDLGDRHINFRTMFKMVDELETMFGRRVDMIESSALAQMDPIRRESIEKSARIIHEIS
jgi:predicted nucleotidyltransferase